MEFFLTGGGDFDHFRQVDQKFAGQLKSQDQILVLPYASDEEDFPDIKERVLESYPKALVVMEPDIERLDTDWIQDSRCLYIEGGNTFDLVTAMRQANLETHFKSLNPKSDKIFYADSAGAIILGASVRTAFFGDDADEDQERLQDYRGMDLLGSWVVHAHYTAEDDDTVMNFVYDEGQPVLALAEETGIHLSSSELQVLTRVPLTIFTAAGKKECPQGLMVDLSEYY